MFVLGRFLEALSVVLGLLLNIYLWIVIIRALLSWVNPDPYNPIVRTLYAITDPVLNFIRRRLPINFGPIDFSPIIVILVLYFLQIFLVGTLRDMAFQLMR